MQELDVVQINIARSLIKAGIHKAVDKPTLSPCKLANPSRAALCHRNPVLVSGTLADRISSPTMTRAAVRVRPGLGEGLGVEVDERPARSRRPSASIQAGANEPSLCCRDLQDAAVLLARHKAGSVSPGDHPLSDHTR